MPKSIMAPIDLAHTEALGAAVTEAAQLAKMSEATLTLVGVTGSAASEAAHNPAEFEEKLAAYAGEVGERFGLKVEHQMLVSHDVAVDLGPVLIDASAKIGADLIVMASHAPGLLEHVFASNAGYVASHAKCSVYVVR